MYIFTLIEDIPLCFNYQNKIKSKSFDFIRCTVIAILPTFAAVSQCKVKFALQQTQRGSRGIALLIRDLSARRGWVVSTTPRPPYPRARPGTHCTGGWVGPRASLDVCEKSRPHRDSNPGPSSP
jgi:hypothetical protein